MNHQSPFLASDLEDLDARLLSRADHVSCMRDIFRGDTNPETIGLRHDVDDNPGSLDTALKLARWQEARCYQATYFLLHDSHYWRDAPEAAKHLVDLGHEVGIHVNAIAESLRQRRHPHWILSEALHELRKAVPVIGAVAHGDQLCHVAKFVNDEMFTECRRPDYGDETRTLSHEGFRLVLEPVSMWEYGLKYDANWLRRGDYLSDSGGRWSQPFDEVCDRFGEKQLHVLQHPDWWSKAFSREQVAA